MRCSVGEGDKKKGAKTAAALKRRWREVRWWKRRRRRRGETGGLIAVNNREMVCAWGAFCSHHNSSRESQGNAQMPPE